jgi:hypothetical protein
MATGFTPRLLEEDRRLYFDRKVRDLINRGESGNTIRRLIFQEPAEDRLAKIQRRIEIARLNELLREHDELLRERDGQRRPTQVLERGRIQMDAESEHDKIRRIKKQEKERKIYLENIVPDILNRGYSYDQLAKIIWPTEYDRHSEIKIVDEIIRQRRRQMTPAQLEAEEVAQERMRQREKDIAFTKKRMSELTKEELKLISGIGPAINKYLKYKSKYLSLKKNI